MFILDSDHATLYQQGHPFLGQHLTHLPPHFLATTVVTYEEQIEGRLAIVRRARTKQERVNAYFWLQQTLNFYCRMTVLSLDDKAAQIFEQLVTLKLRVGTQDLLIASIVLANQAVLLTRNSKDFHRVPELEIQDWSTPLTTS